MKKEDKRKWRADSTDIDEVRRERDEVLEALRFYACRSNHPLGADGWAVADKALRSVSNKGNFGCLNKIPYQ